MRDPAVVMPRLCCLGLLSLLALTSGCPHGPDGPRGSSLTRTADAQPAVAALQAGRFAEAQAASEQILRVDSRNPQARLVHALSVYKQAGEQMASDAITLFTSFETRSLNYQFLRFSLEHFDQALERVDADLAVAAADAQVALELCPACWEVDWNHNGRIDSRDRHLFEVEQDDNGYPYPDDDARRRPTFRFDRGDVYWARALLSFQRALVQLPLAYRLSDLGPDLEGQIRAVLQKRAPLVIHLQDRQRLRKARELVLAGLAHAERSQREYLAETDDDREWVPNPRQRSHPLPLPVDSALYQTWSEILVDVRKLASGEEGLNVEEAARLFGERLPSVPSGYLNLDKLLFTPRDLTIQLPDVKDALFNPSAAMRDVFGAAYVQNLPASRLLSRLARMQGELKQGTDNFERKLRYLIWLN